MIFVTIAVFKLISKQLKNKHGGEKPHSFSQNTHYQTKWLALMTHFLSVQYVMKQLGSVKFVILLHLSKISAKTSKKVHTFKKLPGWL